jgi:hypothetical protein
MTDRKCKVCGGEEFLPPNQNGDSYCRKCINEQLKAKLDRDNLRKLGQSLSEEVFLNYKKGIGHEQA